MLKVNKGTDNLARIGGALMIVQIFPMIWDGWLYSDFIPLSTTVCVFVGLGFISVPYFLRKDWFIVSLNTITITLHLCIQIPRLWL